MKICLILNKLYKDEKIFVPLAYLAFFSRSHEVSLILIDEAVNLARKNLFIELKEDIKQAIQTQTGLDLTNTRNHIEFLEMLKRKFKIKVKVCNTSTIATSLSKRIGDSEMLNKIFDLATLFEISSLISEADLILYF
ncbi:MAG: DsrE family protein [Thermoproteota archaeon]|nr:DsrE family protein [Thermoproteota archaeon]